MVSDDEELNFWNCSGLTGSIFSIVNLVACILIFMAAILGLIIFLYVYFAVGMTIDYKTYAIYKNKYTNKVDLSKVYHRERFYNWVFDANFINYDALPQFNEFTTLAKAKDGPDVSITVSLAYRLVSRDDVLNLYKNYAQKNFESLFETSVKSILRDVISLFEQEEMVTSRSRLASVVNDTISTEVYNTFFYKVISCSLQTIDLPDSYENALVDRAVAGVKTSTASLRLDLDFIKTDTDVRVAAIDQEARTIRLETEGRSRSIALEAQTNATIALLEADSAIFSETKSALSLSNRDLLTFIYYRALSQKVSVPLFLNLQNPLLYSSSSLNTSASNSLTSPLSDSMSSFHHSLATGHSVLFPTTSSIASNLRSSSKFVSSSSLAD